LFQNDVRDGSHVDVGVGFGGEWEIECSVLEIANWNGGDTLEVKIIVAEKVGICFRANYMNHTCGNEDPKVGFKGHWVSML